MKWLEADPLPTECQGSGEEDCYNCDHAGARWVLSREDALIVKRKMLTRAILRLQRKVEQIDGLLNSIGKQE